LKSGSQSNKNSLGERQSYQLNLGANEFVHIVVEQRGINVIVALFGPNRQQIAEIDSPNGTQTPERVLFVTEAAGSYTMDVYSLDRRHRRGATR
jgi:hypothetical protein